MIFKLFLVAWLTCSDGSTIKSVVVPEHRTNGDDYGIVFDTFMLVARQGLIRGMDYPCCTDWNQHPATRCVIRRIEEAQDDRSFVNEEDRL